MGQRWKRIELAVAKFWGGKRNHFTAEDVCHPLYSIEVKSRQTEIKTLEKWLQQAEAAAVPGKVPFVQLHIVGQRHEQNKVVIRAGALKKLLEGQNAR